MARTIRGLLDLDTLRNVPPDQASMDVAERVSLAHLQAGDEFPVWCQALASVVPGDGAAETAAGLLLRWIEDGVLVRLSVD